MESKIAAEPPAFRVGLVWAGQGTHQKDRHRSLPLMAFSELGKIPGVRFYSLQIGDAASQAQSPPPGMTLVDFTADLHDFADTAALINQLESGHHGRHRPFAILRRARKTGVDFDCSSNPIGAGCSIGKIRPGIPPTARLFRQIEPDDWTQAT